MRTDSRQFGFIIAVLAATLAGVGCDWFQVKVPITNINASFTLADATWFEAEQTLFVFYRVGAEQGIGPESQVEITWRTDDGGQAWVPLH